MLASTGCAVGGPTCSPGPPTRTSSSRRTRGRSTAWHLALTDGAADETKGRYGFVFGDFRRVHRMGLIACHFRAAEWDHKEIELAAHELLQHLDDRRRTGR